MAGLTFNIPDFRHSVNNAFAEIKIDAWDVGVNYGSTLLFKSLRTNYDTDKPITKSLLGTPVYSNLNFGDVENPDNNQYIGLDGEPRAYVPLRIDTVLMAVSRTKRIIKTALQGKSGTVKEYIGSDDYMITATGAINVGGHKYPEQDVRELEMICNIPDQIPITAGFLDLFGITHVVIESFNFSEQRGIRNQQAFEITMISDEAPEFGVTDINDNIIA
jgi:hypothetical protein